MTILFKSACLLIIFVGFFLIVWNYAPAADSDKKAKKRRNIGFGLFAVGEVVGLSLWLLGFLK